MVSKELFGITGLFCTRNRTTTRGLVAVVHIDIFMVGLLEIADSAKICHKDLNGIWLSLVVLRKLFMHGLTVNCRCDNI